MAELADAGDLKSPDTKYRKGSTPFPRTLIRNKIMTIHVIQEDINNGKRMHCSDCPVALAVKRKFNLPSYAVVVSHSTIRFDNNVVTIPEIVSDFISKFDNGRYVTPFSFEIELNK